MIMAGVIFKTKFVESGSKTFKNYINYINRDEAVRCDVDREYDLFNDYMGNPQKTSALFTSDKDFLSEEQKNELKCVFSSAQDKGSLLFQSIFSFETEWLQENNIIDEDGILNERKLREYTRVAMDKLFEAENMDGWQWSAAIHHNTDHYHVHIAYVDPAPSWEEGKGRCYRTKEGQLAQRGKIKQKSIEKTKSAFINKAIDSSKTNEYINSILRDRLLAGARSIEFNNNIDLQMEFKSLLQQLPKDMRKWKYNMNAMHPHRAQIDKITDKFISLYFKDDFTEYKAIVNDLSEKYMRAYGDSAEADQFVKSKMDDLYYRMGNSILSECRKIEKANRENDLKMAAQNNGYSAKNMFNKKYHISIQLQHSMSTLKQVLKKDLQSLKNQAAYEQLIKESENNYKYE